MTRRTHWLYLILLLIGVSAVLMSQYGGREARGTLRERTVEVLTADAAAAVQMAHEVLAQERWAEAIALAPTGEMSGSYVPLVWAVTSFARAIGAAHVGQTVRARQEIEELRVLREGLVATRQGDWAAHVELLSRVAGACVAQREGQYAEAVQHLHAAADREDARTPDPMARKLLASARALLGEMLLEQGEFARALHVLTMVIEQAPHRGDALYRAARASELAEDLAKARDFYAQLLGNTDSTTDGRMKLAQARAFLANLTVLLP